MPRCNGEMMGTQCQWNNDNDCPIHGIIKIERADLVEMLEMVARIDIYVADMLALRYGIKGSELTYILKGIRENE